MRIAVLQNNPVIGKVSQNIKTLNHIIDCAKPKWQHPTEKIDLCVLPEMALTGYDFPDTESIRPYVENQTYGHTLNYARYLNKIFNANCTIIGYPEEQRLKEESQLYNAAMVVQNNDILYNYRKKHLFEVDERWAQEGDLFGHIGMKLNSSQTLNLALGICMDLNPWRFLAPPDAFEFGTHCVAIKADLIVLTMAWLKFEPLDAETAEEYALRAVRYWLSRLNPVLESDRSVTIVFCNRTGSEGEVCYHGHSCVVRLEQGELSILGMMRDEEGLLIVDTESVN